MPPTTFPEGIYTIVNARTPNRVLDSRDGKAIAEQFMGCESQRWEMARVVDIAWSFRSISTGRYLGMAAGDQVANHHQLREVEHPFPWHLRKDDPGLLVSILVPYTNYVIDLSDGNDPPKPGAVLKIYQDHRVPHQRWYLCQDLHLATSRALKHGTEYKIVNTQSNTAIEINDAKAACFRVKLDENTNRQKFIAIETQNGWAFRHAETQDYLGLRNSVVPFPDGERLSSVKKEFTWAVLPHHDDTSKFKIWIPFTSRVVDLHGGRTEDDTPIHLFPDRDFDCQWWRFELIPSQSSRDGETHEEYLPGPPEPHTRF
ncbi:hypothetical protein BKA70DRAFT_1343737 [Coprinopsis sp. MPI-PUGE-AT-0042]|nr:hypothetical protein BKA70DRAFT_1343737 [Coprinopsis sp. MPI-PUGE-AT-0042]